jgi:probable F420-dependent oxidoreductase
MNPQADKAARTFRFGVTNARPTDMAEWTAAARRAESLGYHCFLMPETVHTSAPLPALAAAAAATTSLRVGTWVLCNPLHSARVLAWEAASLAALAGGRFELGLGAGRPGAEQDAQRLGLPYGTAGERVQRLADSVAVVRRMLSGDDPDLPAPEHPVPILIAASGPRMLDYAARHADIVALGWAPTTTIEQARPLLDRVRDSAGDRFDQLELAAGLIAVGDGDYPWLRRMGIDALALISSGAVTAVAGTPQQMADSLRRIRDTLQISYFTVPVQSVEAFAPVVELLADR